MRAILPIAILWAVSCLTPGWVHELPQGSGSALGAGAPPDLTGKWIRHAKNVYPMTHPTAYSDAVEQIEILPNGRYTKLHLFAAVTADEEEMTAYREEGTVETGQGGWVRFSPESAGSFRKSGPPVNRKTRIDPAYPFPHVNEIPFSSAFTAAPLLYALDRYNGKEILMPMAFERAGKIYSHGFFQGSESDYDVQSTHFQAFKRLMLEKQFQPSHYVRENAEKSE